MPFRSLYTELNRRNVIRAAITYIAVSWVVLEAASVISPIFDFNQRVMRTLLVLMLIGFIPWLIFAWFYEYTGSGFKKTENIPLDRSIATSTGRRMNAVIIASLSLAVLLLLVDRWFDFSNITQTTEEKKTIAVIPFENMSGGEDQYFSLGISEDILTKISAIPDLKVLSRFTLREYDTKGKTLNQIGKDLKVANLLAGNVRRSGNQLRIGCQLINTADGTEVWAHTFDRPMENIFAIQSEVADQVALFLKAELSTEAKDKIEQIPTENLVAYNYYLRARDHYSSYNGKDNENSIADYKLALEQDPDFALALAGLSGAYSLAVQIFSTRPYEYLDTALVLAKRSTLLSPESAETWNALGLVYDNMGFLEDARTMYLAALEKDPNHSTSLSNLALILKSEGELIESIDLQKKSIEINPLDPSSYNGLSSDYRRLGLYDEALEQLNMAVAIDPDNWITHYYMAYTHICNGTPEKARRHIEQMINLDTSNIRYLEVAGELYSYFDPILSRKYYEKALAHPSFDSRINIFAGVGVGYFLWQEGQQDSANVWLETVFTQHSKLVRAGSEELNSIMIMATIHAIRDENDKALSFLEKVPRATMDFVSWIKSPMSSGLLEEPRFQALIEEDIRSIEVMRKAVRTREDEQAFLKG